MAETAWVGLSDLPPGALFETRDGRRWAKRCWAEHVRAGPGELTNGPSCVCLADGSNAGLSEDTEARELLPDEAAAGQLRRLLEEVRERAAAPAVYGTFPEAPAQVDATDGGVTWDASPAPTPPADFQAAAAQAQQVPQMAWQETTVLDGFMERLLTRLLAWCGLCEQERALLRRLAQEPLDREAALVYADWIEEHGPGRVAGEVRAAAELVRLRAENERLRAALTQIACYEQGPVRPGFDNPADAALARAALEEREP